MSDFRDELIEAMEQVLAGDPAPFSSWREQAAVALDAMLAHRSTVECPECGGDGFAARPGTYAKATGDETPCPTCNGDGRVPGETRLAIVERQVGWQYAHDPNGPLVNLSQAEACDDTRPVFLLASDLPEGTPEP